MTALHLIVLGAPRLEKAGRPIELNLRRAIALLTYLAVTRQPRSREQLAALLWPDSDDREARARLRRTLHRLSQSLGHDLLEGQGPLLRLAPSFDLWVDSIEFEQCAVNGLSAGTPVDRLAQLTRAANLYGGDFLASFTVPDSPEWDDWQFLQRERLRQTAAQVLGELAALHEMEQHWDAALESARRWLALDP